MDGYRVLALAYRDLEQDECEIHIDDLDRTASEAKLNFVGFAIFQNKPKPESKPTIQTLNRAQIISKMSTGDNPLTAISVAREVSMISQNSNVFICDFIEKEDENFLQLQNLHKDRAKGDDLIPVPYIDLTLGKSEISPGKIEKLNQALQIYLQALPKFSITEVAFTGRAFAYLLAAKDLTGNLEYSKRIMEVIYRSKIFARMQPNHKIKLIEVLQGAGRLVAMVGDGANDVGALKTADVGVALSEAEASISAPFSSKVLNISALLEILREGRCTLATNFQCFKFMALYSMIQFTATCILYLQLANLADMQFLWQDLFIIIPVFVTMSFTGPCDELSVDMPPDSLFSLTCLVSVFGQILLQFVGQIILLLILKQQDFFVPADATREAGDFNLVSQESGTLFAYSSMLLIAIILAFSIGRKHWYTNISFTIVIIVSIALLLAFFFATAVSLPLYSVPDSLPTGFRFWTMFAAFITGVIMFLFERYVVNGVMASLERMRRMKRHQSFQFDAPPANVIQQESLRPNAKNDSKTSDMLELTLA
eukprot:CAMPEP_0176405802 /NCGR_PEP_ID=MMETSP0127-20121128/536_1 /TAXON_ID=938130 /ORGANISM="Platyophrya macrostoma, Strain WH" /LENGTH=538 /DNA_ID=CAMNT_0017784893 /DNA_START=162 /DNA_END=1778 /DNA_ORIENTATION=+